jgi:hypothetical protein
MDNQDFRFRSVIFHNPPIGILWFSLQCPGIELALSQAPMTAGIIDPEVTTRQETGELKVNCAFQRLPGV